MAKTAAKAVDKPVEEGAGLKQTFRIILPEEMEIRLNQIKKQTRISIAETIRTAVKFHLMFIDDKTGKLNELELMQFLVEFKSRQKGMKPE